MIHDEIIPIRLIDCKPRASGDDPIDVAAAIHKVK